MADHAQAPQAPVIHLPDGSLWHEKHGGHVFGTSYLSPALIKELASMGSLNLLGAQVIATLYHAKTGGYGVASLTKTFGGSADTWNRVLNLLKQHGWTENSFHRLGHSAKWSATPHCRQWFKSQPKLPQAIRGDVLKALRLVAPCRQDALILAAHILIRTAWSGYHLARHMAEEKNGCDIVQAIPAMDERTHEFEGHAPLAPLYGEVTATLLYEQLSGVSKRTVQRTLTLLVNAGLLARRLTKQNGHAYALTNAGLAVVTAADPDHATDPATSPEHVNHPTPTATHTPTERDRYPVSSATDTRSSATDTRLSATDTRHKREGLDGRFIDGILEQDVKSAPAEPSTPKTEKLSAAQQPKQTAHPQPAALPSRTPAAVTAVTQPHPSAPSTLSTAVHLQRPSTPCSAAPPPPARSPQAAFMRHQKEMALAANRTNL